MNHDNKAREDFKRNPASVFAWILISSWIYYTKPSFTPLLSDECFDGMTRYALDNYDKLSHPHAKPFITKDDLRAGTLFALPCHEYPYWAIEIAERLSLELDTFVSDFYQDLESKQEGLGEDIQKALTDGLEDLYEG